MPAFSEERHTVNGVETVVLTAGAGEPLVFFHGAGTVTGFDALLPLAERNRLIVPYHPGFGRSGDDPKIASIQDYVRHYLDLLDVLGIGDLSLAGHSMGGYMAAQFAIDQSARVRSLVLAAPWGMRDPQHPTQDLFAVPDEEVLGWLTEDMSIFAGKVSLPPSPEFLAERYRESTSAARILWAAPYDVRLTRWLHRLTMPTLLLWGDADRLIPAAQAETWAGFVPGAEIRKLAGVGHLLFDESQESVATVASFVASGSLAGGRQ
jgi:pimeloyl-ACP methyl ester carboxylesterase